MPELETARLLLRMFTPDDLDDLALIFSDPEVTRYVGTGKPQSRDETKLILSSFIEYWKKNGYGRWAVVHKGCGELIGYCGLRLFENAPECVCLLAKAYWSKGLGTEATKACLRYGFEQLQFERIAGITRVENIAAQRVLRKAGMSYKKQARYYDVDCVVHAIKREEYQLDESSIFRIFPDESLQQTAVIAENKL